MKNKICISMLAVLCVVGGTFSGAYGASTVRALGGSGTYSSASSAAANNSESTIRGSSVRVSPVASTGSSSGTAVASTGTTTTGRVATTPRLSLGSYLTGAITSGGSSLRPVTPSGGSSGGGGDSGSGGGGTGIDPDSAAAMLKDIDQLKSDVEGLRSADERIDEEMANKQNTLVPSDDGFIIIDEYTNEIFVDVESLKDSLDLVAGQDGREVEIGSNDDNLLWRYVGDPEWNILISKDEITGPQGPQGEPGTPANLDEYSTTAQMNSAIELAIATLANIYATKEELAKYATSDSVQGAISAATENMVSSTDLERGLAAKADAANVYAKTETYTKQEVDDKVSDIVEGNIGDALTGYVKTEDFNNAIATKADTTAVEAVDARVDSVRDTALAALSDAADAAQAIDTVSDSLSGKQDIANKTDTITNSTTTYPSSAAVYNAINDPENGLVAKIDSAATAADLAQQSVQTVSTDLTELSDRVSVNESGLDTLTAVVGSGELSTTDKTVVGAINELKTKTEGLPTEGNFTEMNEKITAVEGQLADKVDADTLGTLAEKSQIVNSDIADDAAIAKSKLSTDVQESLARADSAVVVEDVGANKVLATDDSGQQTWYEIVF